MLPEMLQGGTPGRTLVAMHYCARKMAFLLVVSLFHVEQTLVCGEGAVRILPRFVISGQLLGVVELCLTGVVPFLPFVTEMELPCLYYCLPFAHLVTCFGHK